MEDFSCTLQKGDSVKLNGYQCGESVDVFVWVERENFLSIAVSVGGEERHVIEIDHTDVQTIIDNGTKK